MSMSIRTKSTLRARLARSAAVIALVVAASLSQPAPALAQGAFAPVILVNDRAITAWELDQYTRFLTILGQPGDAAAIAEDRLIEDRLRLDAAAALGITTSAQAIEAGMAEFAARANLTTEEFLAAVGEAGVEPATFRAFVEAGLIWRDVVRARFVPRVQITDAEVARALETAPVPPGTRVLMSEIVLRADTPEARETARIVLGRIGGREMTLSQFAARATEISAAPSRERGGALEWLPLDSLPPEAQAAISRTEPGRTSAPVESENSVAVYYLRESRAVPESEAQTAYVGWAEVAISDAGTGARIAASVDTCNDLYGVAPDSSETALRRLNLPESQVPADLTSVFAGLDVHETAIVTRGGVPQLVMICRRGFGTGEEGSRLTDAQVREQLLNRRLAALADTYLAELRAEATIRRP